MFTVAALHLLDAADFESSAMWDTDSESGLGGFGDPNEYAHLTILKSRSETDTQRSDYTLKTGGLDITLAYPMHAFFPSSPIRRSIYIHLLAPTNFAVNIALIQDSVVSPMLLQTRLSRLPKSTRSLQLLKAISQPSRNTWNR